MPQVSLLEFVDKMKEIIPIILREFARRQVNELYKGKITLPQFLILELLRREKESRMSDLAHFMRVTTAATTGIVERLVRDGYVVRVYEPQDRRIIKARLTAAGNGLVNKVNEQRRKMLIKIFGKLSGKDRGDYLRILMQIKDILNEEDSAIK